MKKSYIRNMNKLLLFSSVALLSFLGSSFSETNVDGVRQETLQFVQMIFRHGDKSPEKSYPTDPYNNVSFWPGGWNYITDKGKRRMYDLGIYFRQRYPGLLSKKYSQDEIYATSSDRDRTIISASAFLAGLYRDYNLESQWNSDIHWEPIPVRTIEKKYDRYIEVTETCPKIAKILNDLLFNSEFSTKILEDNKKMIDYMVSHSGITTSNLDTIGQVTQTLQIEEENGFELPAWTKRVLDYKPFTGLLMTIHREFHTNIQWSQWTFLRSGPLAQKLISNMEEFIRVKEENKTDSRRKMVLFSGHDRTVVDMMLALKIYHPDIEQPPPYGATLIFELHQNGRSEYFLDVLYKNDSSATPYKMTIPNCESPCYFKDFKTVVNRFNLGDWEEECQLDSDTDINSSLKGTGLKKESKTSSHVLVTLFLFCGALAFIGMILLNRH